MGIYFVFSPPPQKKKETPPTKQHICKPLQANPASKVCKRVVFLLTHPVPA